MHNVTHICLACTRAHSVALEMMSLLECRPGKVLPGPTRSTAYFLWSSSLDKEGRGKVGSEHSFEIPLSMHQFELWRNINLASFKNRVRFTFLDSSTSSPEPNRVSQYLQQRGWILNAAWCTQPFWVTIHSLLQIPPLEGELRFSASCFMNRIRQKR